MIGLEQPAAAQAVSPDRPTIAEAGAPGCDSSSWFGLCAAGSTPPAVVDRFTTTIRAAMQGRVRFEPIADARAEPGTRFGQDVARVVAAERATWGQVVRASAARTH
jgi:tripartite-type tricarboxylate transporter receptor subunit TctC